MDVATLQSFYNSPLGMQVQASLQAALSSIMTEYKDSDVALFGSPLSIPHLLKGLKRQPVICRLSSTGTFAHPKYPTILTHDHNLPVRSHSFDLAVVVQWIEFCDFPKESLLDIWRILVPGGEIILLYPYKWSFLPLSFKTPFGLSKTFTRTQIENLLVACSFTPTKTIPALTGIPFGNHFLFEQYKMLNFLNGVQMSRGLKQELAPTLANPFRWRTEAESAG